MIVLRSVLLAVLLLVPTATAVTWVTAAKHRVETSENAASAGPRVAIAAPSDKNYCSGALKRILRRVLRSCGLLGSGSVRGCQPVQAKNVATMSGADFNALFTPMKGRGGIVQFEQGKATLDDRARALIDQIFADQRGASYFFVVARASPEGSTRFNRELSKKRAEAVMNHLRTKFHDPDLDHEVGLLWLGEEFAQLNTDFCSWRRSGQGACNPRDINRSAFIAWIDCRL